MSDYLYELVLDADNDEHDNDVTAAAADDDNDVAQANCIWYTNV